jgi:hypothetical protein
MSLTLSCKKESVQKIDPQQPIVLPPTLCYDTLSFVEKLEYQSWQIDTIVYKSWAANHDTTKPNEYYPTLTLIGDSMDVFYYKATGPYYFFGNGNSASQGPYPVNPNSVTRVDSVYFLYNKLYSGPIKMKLEYLDSLSMKVSIIWPWLEPHAPYAPYTKDEEYLVLSRSNIPPCK